MSRQSVRIVRVVALSGAAAAAVLGVAGPAVATTRPAVTGQSVQAAVATPVRWSAAGRTITVHGLPATSYTATGDHHAAVTNLATGTGGGQGFDSLTVGGGGAAPATIQSPASGVTPASAPTAGTLGVGVVSTLIVGVIVVFGVRHNKITLGWGATLVVLGVLLQPTFIGDVANNLTSSVVTSAAQALSNL